jgi:isochorismate hydrolase
MSWKTDHRSFYYAGAPEPPDPDLRPGKVALLVIDVQNTYLDTADPAWAPFVARMRGAVIPNTARLIGEFRARGLDVLFARIACLMLDGRDRSLSHRKPGWNDLLLPKDEPASQIVPELAPRPGEVVVTKTTDSALTGTSLRLILTNLGITHDLHRSMRLLHGAQPRRRELRCDPSGRCERCGHRCAAHA